MSTNKPLETIRDGNLKAVIWENDGENGPFLNVSFAKTYRDEKGQYRDTTGFTGTETLRIAELARTAYGRTRELNREYAKVRDVQDSDPGDAPEPERSPERQRPARQFDRSRRPARTR